MAKLLFMLVVGADAYDYFGYASAIDTTKTTAENSGVTWSTTDWGKYETQAIIGFASKGGLFLLSMIMSPISDLMWFFALLSVGEEAYKWTLLTTALDGTTYDIDSSSSFEGAAKGCIGGAGAASLLVAAMTFGSGGDD